jgi:uncharacterized membrane protein YozB (DUF420 family)
MGFLLTNSSSFADMVLIVEIAGFLFILRSVLYAKKKKFIEHDKMAKIAVILGSMSFVWMGYSFVLNFLPFIRLDLMGLLIVSHGITGLVALFIGILLLFNDIKKTKISMRLAFFSWIIVTFLGIIIYIYIAF